MPDLQSDISGWRQAGIDIEVVAGQVKTLEVGFADLKNQFTTLQRDVQAGFSQQAASFSAQMANLAEKIERQGNVFNASNRTSITTFLTTTATVASVLGAFGWAIIRPITDGQEDTARILGKLSEQAVHKEDFRIYAADTGNWIGNLRDRLRTDEDNAVSQRQISELKERLDERYKITEDAVNRDTARVERRTDDLDLQLVKRPEIEAAEKAIGERIDALSARNNAMQLQIDKGR